MGIFGLLFVILPLIIFVILLGIGVTFVRSILRIFGWGSTPRPSDSDIHQDARHYTRQDGTSSSSRSPQQSKKVIGDDEGEYVEFEEVR